MVYAWDYMKHEGHKPMFWAFFTASFGVTLGIAFAANMMTMYLFYELLTLATIPLVMHAMTKQAIHAGVKYAAYSIAGAALAFIGMVFLIVNDAQEFVPGGHLAGYSGSMELLLSVFVLAFVGCGVKAAIWPMHSWLISAAVAPTPVTALLHAVAVVKAGAFACIRLTYFTFGTDMLYGTWGQYTVMALAMITLVFGSAMALKQRHFKRRLAYSTVSNLSYILFAAAVMTAGGRAGRVPAPDRPLGGEDHGLLLRGQRAALRPPGVCQRAGGAGQADAPDLCLLHRSGLRPDGHPALQRLRQQVVHRPCRGGRGQRGLLSGLYRHPHLRAADGHLYVPSSGEGVVPHGGNGASHQGERP